jgi:hypothetical protein
MGEGYSIGLLGGVGSFLSWRNIQYLIRFAIYDIFYEKGTVLAVRKRMGRV